MKRFQSIFCASVLTIALSSAALAGNITTKPGNITTKPGNITTKPGNITTKPGNITTGNITVDEFLAILLATIIG